VAAFPLPLKLDREYPSSGYPGRLQALCEREGLLYLDLEPAFRAAYAGHDSLFIPYDGDHPNAKGHDVAARAIVQVLAPRLTGPLGPGTQ
jgi:lysophospholipase L1-like esterase